MFELSVWLSGVVAFACVALMGLAIQRGGTRTVAAMDELLSQRLVWRLAAMLDASLWVAGGLALASVLGVAGSMPGSYVVSVWTVIGGAVLGLGAFVNGSCVFGTVAKLGAGYRAYALTPLGFFLGCWALAGEHATAVAQASTTLQAASVVALLFAA